MTPAPWHPSMFGFHRNTAPIFSRPQDPLMKLTYAEWWMHGHLDDPPPKNEIFEFPAGGSATMEIACDQGATSYYKDNPNGDIRDPKNPDTPCPHAPTKQFHANNIEDVAGCALSVAYKSDITTVQPEDFAVFTVNHLCVWNLHTVWEVPKDMPPCPTRSDGTQQCICMFGWTHKPDSGAAQSWFPLSNPERDPVR
jgi:hypothetical protein